MKYLLGVLSLLLITACSTPSNVTKDSTEDAANRYRSDALGLSFWYPETDLNGALVTVEETEDTVKLLAAGNTVASIELKSIDVPTNSVDTREHLWKILLQSSETCSLELEDRGPEVETYSFKTSVSPYEASSDENCALYSTVYYFPNQTNQVAVVTTGGQAPTLTSEDDAQFRDSIRLE